MFKERPTVISCEYKANRNAHFLQSELSCHDVTNSSLKTPFRCKKKAQRKYTQAHNNSQTSCCTPAKKHELNFEIKINKKKHFNEKSSRPKTGKSVRNRMNSRFAKLKKTSSVHLKRKNPWTMARNSRCGSTQSMSQTKINLSRCLLSRKRRHDNLCTNYSNQSMIVASSNFNCSPSSWNYQSEMLKGCKLVKPLNKIKVPESIFETAIKQKNTKSYRYYFQNRNLST